MKRPPTSTTRKGNGAGWGPAKGKGKPPFTAETQPPPEAKAAGWDVAKEIREKIAARRQEILDAQFGRALDPAHAQGHQAAKDLLDRIAPVTQQTQISTDGAPLGFVIYGEREAESADAWAEQHKPPR